MQKKKKIFFFFLILFNYLDLTPIYIVLQPIRALIQLRKVYNHHP